jgi:predicted alpha/beta hydrolase family esterase
MGQELQRPLIFIAHSLGGIVVKQVCRTCNSDMLDGLADEWTGTVPSPTRATLPIH